MPTENKAEMFMRLLVDAFETHCMLRNEFLRQQNKTKARHLLQRYRSDQNAVLDRMEPKDCVQLMNTGTPARQVN